jgi:hypothetical protein
MKHWQKNKGLDSWSRQLEKTTNILQQKYANLEKHTSLKQIHILIDMKQNVLEDWPTYYIQIYNELNTKQINLSQLE